MVSDWQPIETAPKNGKTILIYDLDGTMQMVKYCRYKHFEGWVRDVCHHDNGINPVKWMVCPEIPQ